LLLVFQDDVVSMDELLGGGEHLVIEDGFFR
jgi:hypothetical protein